MPMLRYFTYPVGEFPNKEVYPSFCEDLKLEGFKVKVDSVRFRTFLEKGTTCVSCGKEGLYFAMEESVTKDAEPKKSVHFNLYGEKDLLFTSDHIIPKFWGGSDNDIGNRQCMCSSCNFAKGALLEIGTKEEEKVRILGMISRIQSDILKVDTSGKNGVISLRDFIMKQNELLRRLTLLCL